MSVPNKKYAKLNLTQIAIIEKIKTMSVPREFYAKNRRIIRQGISNIKPEIIVLSIKDKDKKLLELTEKLRKKD